MSLANSFRVYFYIRRNRNKHNDCSIYCCIRVEDSIPKEICITGNFKRENWDLKKGRPKQSSDQLLKLSLYLDQIKAKLFEIYLDLKLGKGELSADRVKKIYLHKVSDEYSILELIDLAIKKYQTELAPGSLKNYSATKAYVKEFCKEKYELGDVRNQLQAKTRCIVCSLNAKPAAIIDNQQFSHFVSFGKRYYDLPRENQQVLHWYFPTHKLLLQAKRHLSNKVFKRELPFTN